MSKYNVLHIMADQHQAACIGLHGDSPVKTPNLDRLAREGTFFSSAYCQNPICTPSRVSILTGQYCMNHGYYGLEGPTPDHLSSFPEHFGRHGHRTALIGKLHLPTEPLGWLAGKVDEWSDFLKDANGSRDGSAFMRHLRARGLDKIADNLGLPEFPGKQQHEGRPSNLAFEDSMEGWTLGEAIRFLEKDDPRPFCMQVSFSLPHQCYAPSRQFWDMYDDDELPPELYRDPAGRPPHFQQVVKDLKTQDWLIEPKEFEAGSRRVWRGYRAGITQVDHCVGELLATLEKLGQLDNTVIIYHSDHGAYTGTYGVREKAPGICSDRVCRVPFYMRVPGGTVGNVSNQLIENLDIAPTITSLCGLPPMESFDGQDLTPLLTGDDRPLREIAVTEHAWSKSIRWGDWRFVHYQRGMFEEPGDWGELYNMAVDPDETTNLYHNPDSQDAVHESRRRLLEWMIANHRAIGMPVGYPGDDPACAPETYATVRRKRIREGNISYL